jgi:thioesterase domain-containing protein
MNTSKPDLWSAAGNILAIQNRRPPLTRLPDGLNVSLSIAQERLWALEQSEPGAPYYHIPVTWEITGSLNAAILEQSLDFIFQRHEALRTTFTETADGPLQAIKEGKLQLPIVDLTSWPEAGREQEASRQAQEFVQQPFNLEAGPLMRVVLYHRGEQDFWLVAVFHQMIFDGASMRVFSRELTECYAAFSQTRAPQLPALPVRYTDFSQWQRDCLRADTLQADDDFWRETLKQKYEPLRLPNDHPRTAVGIIPASHVRFSLSKASMDGLKRLSSELGATPFAAFLGAFQAFLGRWSGQEDVLTLVSISARNQKETRNAIGLFANVLPMRLNLSGSPALNQVLERAGEAVSASLAHQSLPLSQILEKLPPVGGTSTSPALQVLVIYNNAPLPTVRLPGVTFVPSLELENCTTKFDLSLDIADSPQGLQGYLKYRSDLFEAGTIERFVEKWQEFVSAALANPSAPLNTLLPAPATALPELTTLLDTAITKKSRVSESEADGLPSSAYVAPRTARQRQLVQVWEKVFEKQPIGIFDNFFGLGGHSLIAVKLINAIEKATGQKLRLGQIFEQPTVERLAAAMDGHDAEASSSLVQIQPRGSKPPLFLVHGVGGGMFWGYNNLAHHLGLEQPVYGFKSRGLEGLEEFKTIETMAAHYVSDLRKAQPSGPYQLGGYCFGGNVAFEMARQLQAAGEKIDLLLLINCWPNNSSYTQFTLDPPTLVKAGLNFCFRLGHQFELAVRQPHDFFKARTRWMFKRARGFFSNDPLDRLAVEDVVDLASRPEHEQKLWRTHVEAWLQYQPQKFDGKIVLLRTRGHPLICSFDREMGWGPYASGGVTVRTCPGDHESILESRNVIHAARELQTILEGCQSRDFKKSRDTRPAAQEPAVFHPRATQPSMALPASASACLSSVAIPAATCLPTIAEKLTM